MFNKDLFRFKMNEKGLTQKKLLEIFNNKYRIDLTIHGIKAWGRAKSANPSLDKLVPLSEILGVSVDELIGKANNERPVNFVPILGTASCGGLEMNFLQEEGQKAFYSGDFWKQSLYCLIANGDSMAPEIEDGDEVIIDPEVACQSGDIVHYKIGNENAIKVLYKDKEANLLQFIPYNQSDTFKTRTIRLDDEDTIRQLTYYKVVSVNKLKFNNRLARLRLVGR